MHIVIVKMTTTCCLLTIKDLKTHLSMFETDTAQLFDMDTAQLFVMAAGQLLEMCTVQLFEMVAGKLFEMCTVQLFVMLAGQLFEMRYIFSIFLARCSLFCVCSSHVHRRQGGSSQFIVN